MSVIAHSVHNSSVPRIAAPRCLFGCDFRPWLMVLFPAWLSRTVLCCRVVCAQARATKGTPFASDAVVDEPAHS